MLTSTPIPGTTLKREDLENGVPLHLVVEHSVQTIPPGQVPVLVALVNLTADAQSKGYTRNLETRFIAARPTQRGLDLVLTKDYVRQHRITVEVHIGFSPAADTARANPRGLRMTFDWAASVTLEFPVADSSGTALMLQQRFR